MRWERGRRSDNLEDRRGSASGGRRRFPQIRTRRSTGGRRQFPVGGRRGGGISLTGLVVIVGVAWAMGINPLQLLGGAPTSVGFDSGGSYSAPAPPAPTATTAAEEELVDFVSWVLDDLQAVWPKKLRGYTDAKLVLFRGSTPSACGTGESAMGPFYCPGDHKVYIDLQFYDELRQRFGAPGDFAQAYVLAHEIGHHVQRLTGVEERVRGQQRSDRASANELSVRMELQADCFAGVWANSTAARGILEPGDVEEGLKAAAAIGDDQLQKMSGREVRPESFTHGTSQQRMRWLRKGMDAGDPNACDTFTTARL